MNGNKVDLIKQAFELIDKDKNGYLDKEELFEVLRNSGFSYNEAKSFVASVDMDKNGKVSFEEFIEFFQKTNKYHINIKK